MPAPKGNEYWKLRSKHGVDGFFNTKEELEQAIDQYFQDGVKIRKVEVGREGSKIVVEIPTPTITGLCFYLGFASRQSFYDLEKKEDFAYTIKRARLFIEQEYEEQLSYGNVTGAIFALKNMGWTDKLDLGGGVDLTTSKLSDEELDAKIEEKLSKLNQNE